ncbi:S8/S53 family peptidase, partial [Lentzea sp.]|uniref:S8 family peptidase n=1 Tax=Lentzea sp. TaxID=56099 RepID=UPI002C7C2C0A
PKIVLPKAGQTWDTALRDPYDRHGHGTGTAAMAVGRNAVSAKTPSALPGGKLAVAKVGTKDGAIEGDLAAAVRWATDTVHANVISLSIGSIVPVPAELFRETYDAFADARRKGVLVVVANGNGWGNAGVLPGDPGWASGYASSTNAVAVGASGAIGLLESTDPEVAAGFSVTSAGIDADNAYVDEGGTSFSAPFVAGFAGALVKATRDAGRPVDPARIEQLLKYAATDTVVPPQFEGYGTLSLAELAGAQAHARAGTLPTRPSPDLSGMYVEQVAGTLRSAWSD